MTINPTDEELLRMFNREDAQLTDEHDVLWATGCESEEELEELKASGHRVWSSIVGRRVRRSDGLEPTAKEKEMIEMLAKGYALVSEPLRKHMTVWAQIFLKMGICPIAIPPIDGKPTKRPVERGWQKKRLTFDECAAAFRTKCTSLGVLLGEPSNGLIDLDIDAHKIGLLDTALRFLEAYMPDPTIIFGRYTAPNSHWLYYVPGLISEKFQDVKPDGTEGAVILELRSTGGQTVFPPSTHQDTGERIAWSHEYEPRLVEPLPAGEFRRRVAWCAAGVLLVKHYPVEGARNMPTKHMAALMAHKGWTLEEVEAFINIIAEEAHDDKIHDRMNEIRATFKNHAEGKKVKGVSGLEENYGKPLASRVASWLSLADDAAEVEEEDFEITIREWPEPPAKEVFVGLVGDFVREWEPHTEASPIALGLQFFAALGSAIGRKPFFAVGGDNHHLNVNMGLVGATSTARKGQSLGCVEYTFSKVDLPVGIPLRTARGLSTGEGLIFAVRDPRFEPDKKGNIRLVDAGVEDKRLLVIETEFASVLRRMSKEGNSLSEIIRQCWDSGKLGTMTRNAALTATDAHISLIVHITFSELRQYLSDVSVENGFSNRFIFAAVRRARVLPDPGRPDELVVRGLAVQIARVIEQAMKITEMKRSPEATALWATMYAELTRTRTGRQHNAVIARAPAQVLRLSMLYAIQDGSAVIEPGHLASAKALWDYAERTSKFVFGDSTGDKLSDFVFDAIKKAGQMGMTQKELRLLTRGIRTATKDGLKFALNVLLSENLVRCEAAPRAAGQHQGSATTTWYAV